MKTLLCAFFLHYWQPTAPPQPTMLLHNFLCEVASQQLNDTDLAEKYLCTALLHRTDEVGEKVRMLFHMTLAEYRTRLRERSINPVNITIIPFDNLTVKPVEITGGTDQVYEAQYGGKHFCYFLMENGKIASLNLVHKDAKFNFFIPYCE